MEADAEAAGDPELALWNWLRAGAPLGLSEPIPVSGVFPPVAIERRTQAEFEELVARVNAARFANYKSFEEEPELARGEIDRLEQAHFLREFATLPELEEYVGGKVLLNKLALLVKARPGGGIKLRLITDLLRSKGNEFLLAPERIVLPRLIDAIEMALYLLASVEKDVSWGVPGAAEEEVEWGSTDIKDAFLNIPVLPADRRAQCYKAFGAFYVSDSLVFGAGPGPLIWGRLAAWLARAAQGLFDFPELLLQIYVDDPLWAVRGSAAARRRRTVVLLLFWEAMGTPFSSGTATSTPRPRPGSAGSVSELPFRRKSRAPIHCRAAPRCPFGHENGVPMASQNRRRTTVRLLRAVADPRTAQRGSST
jgi:hypothetical protein